MEKEICLNNLILEEIEANPKYKKHLKKVEKSIRKLYAVIDPEKEDRDILLLQRLQATAKVMMDVIKIEDEAFLNEIYKSVSDFEDAHP